MRIVHVIAGIAHESGGPTAVVRELSARQAARGHAVTVLTTDGAGGRRITAADRGAFAPGVRLEVHRSLYRRSPHPSPGHAWAAWRAAAGCFDVAHVHGAFALPVSGAMAAFRARGLPYVLRPCGMLDDWSLGQRARLKRAWLALVDRDNLVGAGRVQASTEHEAEAVRRLLPEAARARVVVLPQGVEPLPGPTGRRLHARPYVLFLSRVAAKKGLLTLVDAFARLAAEAPELDLVIVGPDERGFAGVVRARVAALGLGARVFWGGVAAGADKSDWYAGAEVFALPSEDENFGVVVIEAAQLGAPLVVSEAVGLAEAVRRTGAGVVCAREADALAAAISATRARGRAAYAPALAALAAAHRWEEAVARLDALYGEIRGGRGGRLL